jgi:hypothetical protein
MLLGLSCYVFIDHCGVMITRQIILIMFFLECVIHLFVLIYVYAIKIY